MGSLIPVLYRADTVTPLGAFGVGAGVAGLALGVAALPVPGVFVYVRISFPRSRVWQISFLFSLIVRQALAGRDWFQCAFALFGMGGVAVLWLAWALWG